MLKNIIFSLIMLSKLSAFTKVVVPAVYKEWIDGTPTWMEPKIQQKYNFSTFVYQKLDPNKPNYIAKNRGTEAGFSMLTMLEF